MAYGDTALTTQAPGYVQDALNKPFTFSNTQAALNPGQIQQQAADTAYQSATRYLDPQFQRQQAGLENQLANQGITRGSEAWNNATDQFNANKNQAYDQARSQAYTQGLGGANQALNTMFQQSALDTSRQNAQTAADAAKTAGLYQLGGGLLNSPTGMNNVSNLLGGLFGSGNSYGMDADTAKLIGLGGNSSNGLLSGLGGKLSGLGSSAINGLGGLFGSGGTNYGMDAGTADLIGLGGGGSIFSGITDALGGLFGSGGGEAAVGSDILGTIGSFFSEREMKENIEKIGKLDNGLNLYKWDYKPEFKDMAGHGTYTGVMVDEAKKVVPEAVKMHSSGHNMVNYGEVYGNI